MPRRPALEAAAAAAGPYPPPNASPLPSSACLAADDVTDVPNQESGTWDAAGAPAPSAGLPTSEEGKEKEKGSEDKATPGLAARSLGESASASSASEIDPGHGGRGAGSSGSSASALASSYEEPSSPPSSSYSGSVRSDGVGHWSGSPFQSLASSSCGPSSLGGSPKEPRPQPSSSGGADDIGPVSLTAAIVPPHHWSLGECAGVCSWSDDDEEDAVALLRSDRASMALPQSLSPSSLSSSLSSSSAADAHPTAPSPELPRTPSTNEDSVNKRQPTEPEPRRRVAAAAPVPRSVWCPPYRSFEDVFAATGGAPARSAAVLNACVRWFEEENKDAGGACGAGWGSRDPSRFIVVCRTVADHPEVIDVVRRAMRLGAADGSLPNWELREAVAERDAAGSVFVRAVGTSSLVKPSAPSSHLSPDACGLWNVMWSWSARAPVDLGSTLRWQRANHFPNVKQLARKDLLHRHLQRWKMACGTSPKLARFFSAVPTSFVLPAGLVDFEACFHRAAGLAPPPAHRLEPGPTARAAAAKRAEEATPAQAPGRNMWIVKPVSESRGRGIFITDDLCEVRAALASAPAGNLYVAQRYVDRPLLLHGHKFDLRIFALVTSIDPLVAYLHDEGFARVCGVPYAPWGWDDLSAHLTNTEIQRRAVLPQAIRAASSLPGGSKLALSDMWKLLPPALHRDAVWRRVQCAVAGALVACANHVSHNPGSFELLGVDVMLDEDGAVHLLEINTSPSMEMSTPLDCAVKPAVVRDALVAVDPQAFCRAALHDVLARRLASRGRRVGGHGVLAGTPAGEEAETAADLALVLGDRGPRPLAPSAGGFKLLVPTAETDALVTRVRKG